MSSILAIDPSKVKGIEKYAGKYVVLSTSNEVVSSGNSYPEAVKDIKGRKDVALFQMPEPDMNLAPLAQLT